MFNLFKKYNSTYDEDNSDKNDSDSDASLINETDDNFITGNANKEINKNDITKNDDEDSSEYDSSYYDDSEDDKQYQDTVTLRELIVNIAQMSLYALDVFSDTFLAVSYFAQAKYIYAILTLAVIYIAAGIDAYFNRSELKRENPNYKYRYFLTLILNIRGLDIYKNLVGMKLELYRGVSSVKETQEDFFDRNFRVANLKTHEGLFEACPQLLLQLYIMLSNMGNEVSITLAVQIISIFISLCSLAMTFVTGDKARRLYEHECDKFSSWGTALQFFWIFPVTASRILSLSCVASVYPIPSVSCFGVHGFIAFISLRLSQPYTSFGALVAAIRVFLTPYEPIEEYDDEVARRLLRSHLIHFVGNVTSIAIWATTTQLIHTRFSVYVSILFFFGFGFVLGVTSLVILLKYKKDCFVQEDEQESKMDRRMKPYLDYVKSIGSRIEKFFRTLTTKCAKSCKRA